MGQGRAGQESQEAIDASRILKHDLRIHLAETTHIGVVGEGRANLKTVAHLDQQLGTGGNRFLHSFAVGGSDHHIESTLFGLINRSNAARHGGVENAIVGFFTGRVHLAPAPVATHMNLIFTEVNVAIGGGIR